ncbi:NAD-dependent epimerase/dehydratase family protein [Actinokineospora sp. HUAS TT18]|uniref:NAD-dependent epimerase/dehydratase family protein n=1 Tax=Actinokineospora sp. HUAS TT18 TaxID=3447451 RepID=UPI003F51C1D3
MGNICVIGGTRFFGKVLVRELMAHGHRVTVLTRGRTGDPFGDKVDRLTADANDVDQLSAAVAGHEFDAVIHQMCYSPVAALAAVKAFDGRIGRLVMTSTIEVYRDQPGVSGFAAEHELDPSMLGYDMSLPWHDSEFLGNSYAEGKRQAEGALAQAATFPVAFVRLGHVLAEGEFTGRLAFHVDRVLDGGRIAAHRSPGRSSFGHAREIAAFLAWMGGVSLTGPVNASSPDGMSAREFVSVIEEVTGRSAVFDEVDDADDPDLSPFSYAADFGMSVGYEFSPVSGWLPEVVRREVAQRAKWSRTR